MKTFSILTALALMIGIQAHAGELADPNGDIVAPLPAVQIAPQTPSAGDGFPESRENAFSSHRHVTLRGYSWRNVKRLLMERRQVRDLNLLSKCPDAKTAALCLERAGFCQIHVRDLRNVPVNAVIVYNHLPHGNTVIKVGENEYFDNELRSGPPPVSARDTRVSVWAHGMACKAR